MLGDYEMISSCHMIEKAECPSHPLHLAASILVPFFMTFYSVKVVRGMVTFGKSRCKSLCHLINTADESM